MQEQTVGHARVAVIPADAGVGTRQIAAELARTLNLPILEHIDATDQAGLLLRVGGPRLELIEVGAAAPGPVYVDFAEGPTAHRARSGKSRHQLLATAIGLKRGPAMLVDATAGLGADAFHLASLGCQVTAVERSPVLAALLRDGLARAAKTHDARLASIIRRIDLVAGDAKEVLAAWPRDDGPDVVFLDPMYAPRKRSTQVRKAMRLCRLLVGDDEDAVELFESARCAGASRVVVKRHRLAPPLWPAPSLRYTGSTVRYDVYFPASSHGMATGRARKMGTTRARPARSHARPSDPS